MRRPILAALAAVAALSLGTVDARMQFLRPPEFDGTNKAATRAVHTMGTALELQWTPAQQGKKLSAMLYPLNATRAAAFDGVFDKDEWPYEYIVDHEANVTSLTWTVKTTRNIAGSALFSIALWEEGALVTDSATDVFTIVASQASSTSSSTSSSATSSSTASTTSSSTAADATGSGSSPGSAAGATDQGGLSTGAVIGVALGSVAGVMLLAAGWWFGRRHFRARRGQESKLVDAAIGDAVLPVGELEQQSGRQELELQSGRQELEQQSGRQELEQHSGRQELEQHSGRYELDQQSGRHELPVQTDWHELPAKADWHELL